jgi:hypothetical protein
MIKLTLEELEGLTLLTVSDMTSFSELNERYHNNQWWERVIEKHNLDPEADYEIAQENNQFYLCKIND